MQRHTCTHANTHANCRRRFNSGQTCTHANAHANCRRRFNSGQAPSPEWAAFGSYLFALPLLEYLEVEGGCVLATTLAWDSTSAQTHTPQPARTSNHASDSQTPASQSSSASNGSSETGTVVNNNSSSRATSSRSSESQTSGGSQQPDGSQHPPSPPFCSSATGTGAPTLRDAVCTAADALQHLMPAAPRTAPAHHVQVGHLSLPCVS
jgi:hypothetical protein